MRVVLTREAGRNDELRDWLPDHASVVEVPLTRTHYVETSDVERSLHEAPDFGDFAVLVVTSSRTKNYVELARAALRDDAVILSVGPATTHSLHELGVVVSGEATSRAVDLGAYIMSGPVLLLGASQMRDELTTHLAARSISVTHVACYVTRTQTPNAKQQEMLARAQVVLIGAPTAWAVASPFVSPSTWVVVPGAGTAAVVLEQHERVLEGWGPSLHSRLMTLEP